MPTVNLTAKLLASLRAPEQPGGRVEYFDQSVPGFGVRVTRDGRRTFTFLYWYAGKKCRLKLGTHPPLSLAEAREAAKLAWAGAARQ
jgi:Arm domain-containing DNA-binding protein